MMNHPQRDDDQHMFRLFAGVTVIMFLTTGVILGPDGIAALWNLIF